eukprot:scaffold2631_cov412-Prasinococcus_capsulatus_cf.AAC.11
MCDACAPGDGDDARRTFPRHATGSRKAREWGFARLPGGAVHRAKWGPKRGSPSSLGRGGIPSEMPSPNWATACRLERVGQKSARGLASTAERCARAALLVTSTVKISSAGRAGELGRAPRVRVIPGVWLWRSDSRHLRAPRSSSRGLAAPWRAVWLSLLEECSGAQPCDTHRAHRCLFRLTVMLRVDDSAPGRRRRRFARGRFARCCRRRRRKYHHAPDKR